MSFFRGIQNENGVSLIGLMIGASISVGVMGTVGMVLSSQTQQLQRVSEKFQNFNTSITMSLSFSRKDICECMFQPGGMGLSTAVGSNQTLDRLLLASKDNNGTPEDSSDDSCNGVDGVIIAQKGRQFGEDISTGTGGQNGLVVTDIQYQVHNNVSNLAGGFSYNGNTYPAMQLRRASFTIHFGRHRTTASTVDGVKQQAPVRPIYSEFTFAVDDTGAPVGCDTEKRFVDHIANQAQIYRTQRDGDQQAYQNRVRGHFDGIDTFGAAQESATTLARQQAEARTAVSRDQAINSVSARSRQVQDEMDRYATEIMIQARPVADNRIAQGDRNVASRIQAAQSAGNSRVNEASNYANGEVWSRFLNSNGMSNPDDMRQTWQDFLNKWGLNEPYP